MGDSVDYVPETNLYTENPNGRHSPILAWARDGLPVYGPNGHSDPNDSNSPVVRMRSGFQIRTDIASNGSARSAWATRIYAGQRSFASGPNVSAQFPLGRYMEDNDYKGDLGMTLGVDFDLNEYNVRYCVTPEFPEGTWAYFVCIDAQGIPIFPYNIGRSFFGDLVGSTASAIPDSDEANAAVDTVFEGGPENPVVAQEISRGPDNELTLVWKSAEGGIYEILSSPELSASSNWASLGVQAIATSEETSVAYSLPPANPERSFQRIKRIDVIPFDDNGFEYDFTANPSSEETVRLQVTLPGSPSNLYTLPSARSQRFPLHRGTCRVSLSSEPFLDSLWRPFFRNHRNGPS